MPSLIYFAYGSNLHPVRLGARIASAKLLGACALPGYSLAFHKRGGDGSAKCDAWCDETGNSTLPGAIYEMSAEHQATLDEIEGPGYRVDMVSVNFQGQRLDAFCYIAEPEFIDPQLQPFSWYKALVYRGAQYHGFAKTHLQYIAGVAAIEDHDSARMRKNQQVLELM